MALTDGEVLELFEEIDRFKKIVARIDDIGKDLCVTQLNHILNMSENSTVDKSGDMIKQINSEIDRVIDAKSITVEHVKDLKMRIRQAIGDKQPCDADKKN